jgi:hypothetical protein
MTKKYRPNDPRILDDIDNAPESAKNYLEAKARDEAASLLAKYADSPTFLRVHYVNGDPLDLRKENLKVIDNKR